MFGDDPDPSVTTERVGFGTTFVRARGVRCTVLGGVRWLGGVSGPSDNNRMAPNERRVRFGLALSGSGLCRKPRAKRREERDPTTVSGDRKCPAI